MASNWSWQCSRGHEAPDRAETCPVCGDTDLDWRSTGTAKEWDVGALLYIVVGLGLVAGGLATWVNADDGDTAIVVVGGVLLAAGFFVGTIGAVAEGIRMARPD
ncbi:hypothetical protein ABKW28_11135 [Nocardioides sp. 31GB23]|uniref:hypothetical protein n=1 Tax=Nocardioides sp. 31GB23 TaxID=3156065 RepID=UPI0032B016D5